MADIGGLNFTNFSHVRLKGTKDGTVPGALRIVATSALESTLSVNTTYQDSSYQWTLPAKSGGIGITGTFTLHLPAITAGNVANTNVVISGIRAEDAFICTLMTPSETAVTSDRGRALLVGAVPTNTGINLTFFNPTATATVYGAHTVAYTAYR